MFSNTSTAFRSLTSRMRSTTANQCHIITYLFTETFKYARFQWQNEFVRFRRVLVKREISSLISLKMGTAWSYYKEKRREKKKLKRWVDFSFILIISNMVILSGDWEKNSRFLGAINLKQTQNAIDNNFAKPFLCTCTNAMK